MESPLANPFDQGYFETAELRKFGFKRVGEHVKIAKNATLIGLNNISIGNHVRIDGNVIIAAHSGSLTLGRFIHIGAGCYLGCAGGVSLSDFSGLSQGVKIYSGSDDYSGQSLTNPSVPAKYLDVKIAPVVLCRHVIIGAGSILLPGVTIGEGSAVGALSFVSRSLDAWGIYGGAPAKKLKARSKELLKKEKELLNDIM